MTAAACLPAAAEPFSDAKLWRILASTPAVVRQAAPQSAHGLRYVRVRGTLAQGYVNPKLTVYGRLSNGQDVLIVPLVSGGSGGIFYALLYTQLTPKARFVGYIPAHSGGHLQVFIERGMLKVVTPLYAATDAQCCPSKLRSETYTLHGIRLARVGVAVHR